MQIAGNDSAESTLRHILDWHNLGLLELFGLVSVQHGLPKPRKGWHAERAWRAVRAGDPPAAQRYAAHLAAIYGPSNTYLSLELHRPFDVILAHQIAALGPVLALAHRCHPAGLLPRVPGHPLPPTAGDHRLQLSR